MHTAVLLVLGVLLYAPTHADERNTSMKDVTLFYEAFNTKDFGLLDRILRTRDDRSEHSQPPVQVRPNARRKEQLWKAHPP